MPTISRLSVADAPRPLRIRHIGTADLLERRIGFHGDLRVDRVTLRVGHVATLTAADLAAFTRIFNRYGFVVLQCEPAADPREESIALGRLLGTPAPHDRADHAGIVPIDPSNPVKGYLGSTNEEHPLHTDGAFADQPERIMTLQCEVPATEGGLSILASAKAAYDHLREVSPHLLAPLFRADALTVRRTTWSSTKAVFQAQGKGLGVTFRADAAADVRVHPAASEAYERLRAFFFDPAHQVRFRLEKDQILIVDNTALVHGRTPFPAGMPRRLNRLNFDGAGALQRRLAIGFADGGRPAAA